MRVRNLSFHRYFLLGCSTLISVVFDNFNLHDSALRPLKTKSPLVIEANAMLTLSVFLQGFEFVLWRDFQVI